MDREGLPEDVEALKALVLEERTKREVLQRSNDRLARELERLKARMFGRKNERLASSDQLLLWADTDQGADLEEPEPAPRKKPRGRRGRGKVPSHLPRRRVESRVLDDQRSCTVCGGPLKTIGEATSGRLEWVPGRFVHLEIAREKCACPAHPEAGVVTAPAPAFALDKALPGNGLLAKVIVDKYADHIPLNRQARRFKRIGVSVNVGTMCGWLKRAGAMAGRLVDVMLEDLVAGDWLQSDATGLPVLDGTPGQPRRGHFYSWSDGEHAVYTYARDGKAEHPKRILDGFQGVLVVDGGSAFHHIAKVEGVERAGCWAHCRRKFFEARDADPVHAAWSLGRIREIFLVERTLRKSSPEQRARARRELLGPLLEEFHAWCQERALRSPPDGPLGQAVGYALRQWDTLIVFVDNGEIPAHNNRSELLLRQPVVGRKQWLFAGSEGGAKLAATWFSLVGSCMLQAVDPQLYLTDVLPRLPDHPVTGLRDLTPAAWRVERLGLTA